MRIQRFLALGAIAMILALFAACGGDEPEPAAPTPTPADTMMAEATPTPADTMMAEPTPAPDAMAEPTPAPDAMATVPTPTPVVVRPTATPVPPPPGFDAEAYFGGRTIKIITGTSPGGGYDTFSRIVAATAVKFFPENTRFIVQNLPGAGQLRGLRAVLNAEPDGLTIGPVHQRWWTRQALVGDIDGFDLDRIHILGSPTFGQILSAGNPRRLQLGVKLRF